VVIIQPKLQVETVPTDTLVPYVGNAKEHPEWQVEQIANSINQFGFNDPVGVWHDGDGNAIIVEGHGRVLAAKLLGMQQIPVVTLDHLDDEGRRAYTLAHNKLTTNTGYDEETLIAELNAISNIDMTELGFDESELSGLEDIDGVTEDEPPAGNQVEQRVNAGELWRMGEHFLLCGDATNLDDVAKVLGGGLADLLLTDPPYNVDYVGGTSDKLTIANDNFDSSESFRKFIADSLIACKPHLQAGAAFYIWFATRRTKELFDACSDAELEIRQELYWIKQQFVLGRQDYQWQTEPCLYGWKEGAAHWFAPTRSETNVIEDKADLKKMSKADLRKMLEDILSGGIQTDALHEDRPMRNGEHPTMKPVSLFARLIRNSTRRGQVVLDVFAGSGTTVAACEQMGRKARLIELDPHYCDVILARWENLTGQRAELVSE
jgi:DNA modification methylase